MAAPTRQPGVQGFRSQTAGLRIARGDARLHQRPRLLDADRWGSDRLATERAQQTDVRLSAPTRDLEVPPAQVPSRGSLAMHHQPGEAIWQPPSGPPSGAVPRRDAQDVLCAMPVWCLQGRPRSRQA
jgi:hypothetical protein